MKSLNLAVLIILTATSGFTQTTYYSNNSTSDFNTLSGWGINADGTGSNPAALDNSVILVVNHSKTTSSVATIRSLTINSGGTVQANDAITLNGTGATFTISNGGVYIHNNTTSLGSTIFSGTESFSASSTFEFLNCQSTSLSGATYGNLTFSLGVSSNNAQLAGNTSSVQGNLTISSNSSRVVNLSGSSTLSLTIGGDLIIQSGTLDIANATGSSTSRNISISGNYNQSGGVLQCTGNSNSATITFTGNNKTFSQSSGTLTGTNINWVVQSGASLTLNNNLSISSTRSISISGTLVMGTASISGSGDFTLSTGGTLESTHTSGLDGNITVSGTKTFSNNGCNYTFNGATSTPFPASGTIGTINNLAAGENITINRAVSVTGSISFQNVNSKTITTGGNITLISNASGTARIADLTNIDANSGNAISGNIIAQRYIGSSGRRWRFLASPVTSRTLADWQATMHITGTGGATNGFDATATNQSSVYTYNETLTTGDLNTGWTAASANTDPITVGKGYRVFVRGSRDPGRLDGTVTTQDAVTLSLTGGFSSGTNYNNVNMNPTYTNSGTSANDGWNFMGNPYACPINWNTFHDAGRSGSGSDYSGTNYSHLAPTVYIFNGSTNSYESYNAVSDAFTNSFNGIIPSGCAFFIQAAAASPTMTLREIYKSEGTPITLHKSASSNEIRITFSSDSNELDQYLFKLFENSTKQKDGADIPKIANPNLNISSYGTDGVDLTASCYPKLESGEIVPLTISSSYEGRFTFKISDIENFSTKYQVYLRDNFDQTITNLRKNNLYSFDITKDANSQGNKRFELIFSNSTNGVSTTNDKSNEIIVYPNPANEFLWIKNGSKQAYTIEVFDVSGRSVIEFDSKFVGNETLQVNLQNLQKGIYFIKMQSLHDNDAQVFKIMH